jgi:hypothetical protein
VTPRFAIATPSYGGDLERCKLLCASVDRFVANLSTHYLLVEDRDVALFASLAGPKRRIVAESEIFPAWLRARSDPFSLGKRRVWTGIGALAQGVPPLRGWHTQQLRKLALPLAAPEDVILHADSDAVFLKDFDLSGQVVDGLSRLYVKPAAITADMREHVGWARHAARILGLGEPALPAPDYVNNLPTWTRSNALKLMAHLEARTGRHWIAAVAGGGSFSEMTIYGMFVEGVLGEAAGHRATPDALARTYWTERDVAPGSFRDAETLLGPGHVSIGVQSFIGVPVEDLWDVFRRAAVRR